MRKAYRIVTATAKLKFSSGLVVPLLFIAVMRCFWTYTLSFEFSLFVNCWLTQLLRLHYKPRWVGNCDFLSRIDSFRSNLVFCVSNDSPHSHDICSDEFCIWFIIPWWLFVLNPILVRLVFGDFPSTIFSWNIHHAFIFHFQYSATRHLYM